MTKKNDKSTELAATQAAQLAELEAAELALSEAQLADVGMDDLVIPMLKLAQPLTAEVTDGSASAGEYINSITGQSFGEDIEFIVAAYQKGRFQAKDGVIIEASQDSSGLSKKGVPYSEDPEAEEQWKAAVNRGEKEWGEGPPIATTYNFVGFVVIDGELSGMPVRFSVSRASAPVAKKWLTALKFAKPMWAQRFRLGVRKEQGQKGTYFVPTVRPAGDTSAEQRQAAVELAQAVRSGDAKLVDDNPEPTAPAKPAAEPGMDI